MLSPEILWPIVIVGLFATQGLLTVMARPWLWSIYVFVLLVEVAVPFGLYIILRLTHRISDWDITNVKERRFYFTVLAIIHGLGIILLWRWLIYVQATPGAMELATGLQIYLVIRLLLWLVQTIGTIITFFWKISAHLIMYTSTVWLCTWLFPSAWLLLLVLWLGIPVLAWSRIYLHKHTLGQTIAGFGLASVGFVWPWLWTFWQ